MQELSHFKYSDRDDLTAAILGISSIDWVAKHEMEISQGLTGIFSIMSENRFDIIPVHNQSGLVDRYIITKKWGLYELENLQEKEIDFREDVIYYLTHVRDVLRLMNERNRNFYFLGNHSEIVGLITLANFNDKHFYFWLYKKLVQLEKGMAKLIRSHRSEEEILNKINLISLQKFGNGKHFLSSLRRFEKDQTKGLDAPILEYLYFSQLCQLIIYFNLQPKKGLVKDDFESDLDVLKDVRNIIAHPTKSLVSSPNDLKVLWRGVKKMDILTSQLK
jgi:hypothetical protein